MSRNADVRLVDGKLELSADCSVSGKRFTVLVNHEAWLSWMNGTKAKDAFPELSPAQREFIMTGTTPEEWNALAGYER